jgi:hypothetical protein
VKSIAKVFGSHRSMARGAVFALGYAVVLAAPALAAADLPPFAGSSDDVSYGDTPHATFTGDPAAPGTIAQSDGTYDDVSYGAISHATMTAEPPTADEALALDLQHDDVSHAIASPRPEREAVAATERVATGRLAAVDGAGIVVHQTAAPDLHLAVDPGTRLAMNGHQASLADLHEGSEIRATYQTVNGEAKAIRVEAQSAGQAVQSEW